MFFISVIFKLDITSWIVHGINPPRGYVRFDVLTAMPTKIIIVFYREDGSSMLL
jgi:hypothetical protein